MYTNKKIAITAYLLLIIYLLGNTKIIKFEYVFYKYLHNSIYIYFHTHEKNIKIYSKNNV